MVCAKRLRVWASGLGAALAALLTLHVVHAAPPPPTMHAPVVVGAQVTLTWTASPAALGYRLSIGLQPGVEQYGQVVGPITSLSFTSPFVGSGYVRVQAFDLTGLSAPSNEVVLTVGTTTPAPAAPVNLQAAVSGRTVTLTWGAGSGGGLPLGVVLEAGTAPGSANVGSLPLPPSTQFSVPNVVPGTYFARVYAVNGSGRSAPSNEVRIDVATGGSCGAPASSTLSPSVSGTSVSFSWTEVPGVAGYRLEVSAGPSGPVVVSQAFAAGVTSAAYASAPAGTYYGRIVSVAPCGAETSSDVVSFSIVAPPPGPGGRTPDPPPGQRLPLPDMSEVAYAVGRAFPSDLRHSCVESGGTNVWLFRLVQELRRRDTRWGLNWKRGRRNDMSQDVVNYNFSADSDEDTTNVYIIDVIAGHCGGNPQAAWIDNTEATRQAGTIGRWTLQPYLAAGWTP